jgi:hypothetical protein
MTAIKSCRYTRLLSLFLAVATMLPLTYLSIGAASAQPERAKTMLLFPAVDDASSPVPDLSRRVTNAMQIAIADTPGFECAEFSTTSPMVRRAIAEGRVRAVDADQMRFGVSEAIRIGHALQVDGIVLAYIQSYRVTKDPRKVEIILSGQSYLLSKNWDKDTDDPITTPVVERAYGVVGVSDARKNYNGSNLPLMRQAVDDAAYKAADSLTGRGLAGMPAAGPSGRGNGGSSWALGILIVGLLAVAVGGAN